MTAALRATAATGAIYDDDDHGIERAIQAHPDRFYGLAGIDPTAPGQVGQSMIYAKDQPTRSVRRPITLDAVVCDMPELKLSGMHVGIPWTDEMIAMAWKHP